MASSTATKKLPTVAVFTYYLSKNTLKSSRGLPIGEDFDAEWRKRMGNVPYQKIDIEKPMDEVLPLLQEAEVILGDANLIGPIFGKLTKTRWIQGTWAGVDSMMKKIDPSALPPPFIFTRLGGALPTVMAEYVIGNMIALERGFLQMQRNQEQRVWQKLDYRSLEQITIGIVGLGDIGEEIARLCKAFKMTIWGLGRRELAPDQTRKYVDHYRTLPGLTELLANCDYICNVLPKTAATDDLLSGDMLANCTRAPVLINVGRGNVISEESLLAALDKGWISHAILDVFRTEPLPESSLLWTSPKVTISPHNSAFSFTFKICETFADNFDRYINGQPLKYQVNWDIGY